jgi:hypothetical protein
MAISVQSGGFPAVFYLKDFCVSLSKAIKDDDSQKVPSWQDGTKDLDQRLEKMGNIGCARSSS